MLADLARRDQAPERLLPTRELPDNSRYQHRHGNDGEQPQERHREPAPHPVCKGAFSSPPTVSHDDRLDHSQTTIRPLTWSKIGPTSFSEHALRAKLRMLVAAPCFLRCAWQSTP